MTIFLEAIVSDGNDGWLWLHFAKIGSYLAIKACKIILKFIWLT